MLDNINFKQQPSLENDSKRVWFSKKDIVLYVVIFLLSIIIIGGWFNYKPFDSTQIENQLKISEKKQDSLNNISLIRKQEIVVLKQDIQLLNGKLDTNSKELKNLKQELNEQENIIDTYSYDELYMSITGRYSEGYDQNDVPDSNR
jgi:predicted negative regulator of RcsB-dependent stress response